jgi:hypothetical protein
MDKDYTDETAIYVHFQSILKDSSSLTWSMEQKRDKIVGCLLVACAWKKGWLMNRRCCGAERFAGRTDDGDGRLLDCRVGVFSKR